MSELTNKNILLGVTGGIAAYKSADLVRRLQDTGAVVRVVMTPAATEFVTPMTFQALSGQPVHTDLFDLQAEAAMGHIELARWADLILIAPASANTLAKISWGQADNLLTTLCLASKAPVAVAPAMNNIMWEANATQDNIQRLIHLGMTILGPASGAQACGETGEGRMLEPMDIIHQLNLSVKKPLLKDLKVMITAGPTFEAIDPVRYIGNRSSGRMGFAIAQAARDAGAVVTLITGPVQLNSVNNICRINVESASQMHDAVMDNIDDQDIFIGTAAVADYCPTEPQNNKIKKSSDHLNISLKPTPDILSNVAALKNTPFTVGFAAETDNIESYAKAKLENKKLNMIAANLVAHNLNSGEDTGFNSEYNELDVYWGDGHIKLPKAKKTLIAQKLIELIAQCYKLEHTNT
jgi:phosphopantothenoylcysteine decarboxylase / phosphopantothenate---cysteine ligase